MFGGLTGFAKEIYLMNCYISYNHSLDFGKDSYNMLLLNSISARVFASVIKNVNDVPPSLNNLQKFGSLDLFIFQVLIPESSAVM